MRKALGLIGILLVLGMVTYLWELYDHGTSHFLTPLNLKQQLVWIGLFGILSVGQALVIISGGIDLSVGSVIALIGISLAMLLDPAVAGLHPALAIIIVLALAAVVGLWHGFLIAILRIQPFVATLCGLFAYRGIARVLTGDTSQGFGLAYPRWRAWGRGSLWDTLSVSPPAESGVSGFYQGILDSIPAPFVLLLVVALVVGAYLHFTAPGRHLFALGANEDSARFSGIATKKMIITAYVLCSVITACGGILLAFKVSSLGPTDFGSFYELYAIAGAVLGGCSLRGGTGNLFAVLIGASLIVILRNLVTILGIPSQLEYVVIGGAILLGVCVDEVLMRRKWRGARGAITG